MATKPFRPAARLALTALLTIPALAIALADVPSVAAAGSGLELALQAPSSIDGVTRFDFWLTVRNDGPTDCRVSSSPAAVVLSVTADGAAVKPTFPGPGVVMAGVPLPAASLVVLPAGGTVSIPVTHDPGSIDAVSLLPDDPGTAIVEQFSLAAPGSYAISVGLAPLAVAGCDPPAAAAAALRVDPPSTGVPAVVLAGVLVLVLIGAGIGAVVLARRRRAARALVVALAIVAGSTLSPRPAIAQILYHFGPVGTAAADACGKLFSAPATSAGPGGDPAGIWAEAQASSHTIHLDGGSAILATFPATKGKAPLPPGVPTDSTVFWQTGLYAGNGVPVDDCANLYHLLAFAVDIANGTFDVRRRCPGSLSWEEVRATLAENQYRASYGLPTVTTINGVPLPASLDDCKATPKPKRKGQMKITCRTASCAYVGGDPHDQTFDGLRYDFQAAGEFVLARAASGPFEIQVRQQPVPGSGSAAAATAVAARVGDARVMLGVAVDPDGAGTHLAVTVDGAPFVAPGPLSIGTAGSVEESAAADQVALRWADGSAALASIITGSLAIRVDVRPSDALRGNLAGLLGNDDGTGANDLVLADGSTLAQPASFSDLDGPFADAWRVTDATSLFSYDAGTSTATFTDRSFPSEDATAVTDDQLDATRALCAALGIDPSDDADLADCAFDLAATGQASFASASIDHSLAPLDDAVDIGGIGSGSPTPTPDGSPGVVDRGPMAPGDTVTGTIGTPTERELYHLRAAAGTIGVFTAGGDCSPLSGGGSPTWHLARAAAPDVPITGTLPFCVDLGRYTFAAAGDYVLVLDAGGYTVPYSFTWTGIATSSDAPIALGTDITGSITTAGQRNTYRFSATGDLDIRFVSAVTCDDGFVWKVTEGESTTGVGTLCGTSQPVHLGGGGTWQIVISNPLGTGGYSFRIEAGQP